MWFGIICGLKTCKTEVIIFNQKNRFVAMLSGLKSSVLLNGRYCKKQQTKIEKQKDQCGLNTCIYVGSTCKDDKLCQYYETIVCLELCYLKIDTN